MSKRSSPGRDPASEETAVLPPKQPKLIEPSTETGETEKEEEEEEGTPLSSSDENQPPKPVGEEGGGKRDVGEEDAPSPSNSTLRFNILHCTS